MAYCTTVQVEELMGIKFMSTSRPATNKVTETIDEVAGEIDGVLTAAGYDLPIAGVASLQLLRRYNTFGAAAACWHTGYATDNSIPRVEYWQQEYKDFLSRMRRGEQYLPDVDLDDDTSSPAFGVAPAAQRDQYWLTGETL
jgi:hypothetical protein